MSVTLLVSLLLPGWSLAAAPPAPDTTPHPAPLFLPLESDLPPNVDLDELLEPDIYSEGVFRTLNAAALRELDEAKSRDFSIALPRADEQVVELTRSEGPSARSTVWKGGDENRSVTLVIRRGTVRQGDRVLRQTRAAGTIRTADGRTYDIRGVTEDLILLRQFDSRQAPRELEPIVPDVPLEPVPDVEQDVSMRATREFAVAVFYTDAAEQAAGGSVAIRARIDDAVVETNEAYTDSGITARIRLVHVAETMDNESGGFSGMLRRLQNVSDGGMDEIHGLRDRHRADLVVLLCADSAYCGLAYRMATESADFDDWAFSVVNHNCAVGYFSFGHELGHNMGCCHDRANPCDRLIYPYAYGWHFDVSGREQRTIMAYAPGDRIKRFSNPHKMYLGVATGKSDEADNARTINNTSDTVSSFR